MITTSENFGGVDHCNGEHLMHRTKSFLLTTESNFGAVSRFDFTSCINGEHLMHHAKSFLLTTENNFGAVSRFDFRYNTNDLPLN